MNMTKRIGIEINGVLRDTIGKFKQLYEKHLVDVDHDETLQSFDLEFDPENSGSTELSIIEDKTFFNYEIKNEVTSLNLMNHFAFRSKDELYSFMYEDYTMELFGHAPSTEINTFNILNELYYKIRENHDLIIVSDEIGKSKPSSLFFLSKFGCLIEKVLFYSEVTKNKMFDEIDVLLTSNPALLLEHPEDKFIIKYQTEYNKHIKSDNSITTIKELEFELTKIK